MDNEQFRETVESLRRLVGIVRLIGDKMLDENYSASLDLAVGNVLMAENSLGQAIKTLVKIEGP